jgi:hypothetical protein
MLVKKPLCWNRIMAKSDMGHMTFDLYFRRKWY